MTSRALNFQISRDDKVETRPIALNTAIIAGWTGRDAVARDKHIAELEALGVARPASTPIHYRVSNSLLTTADEIEVVGENSSGEVEFVLLRENGRIWLGAGSDHTDRKVETYNVTISKQLCEKPMSPELWDFEDVAQHWDKLQMRSWIEEGGKDVLYQEGSVAAILPPQDIIAKDGLIPSLKGSTTNDPIAKELRTAPTAEEREATRISYEGSDLDVPTFLRKRNENN